MSRTIFKQRAEYFRCGCIYARRGGELEASPWGSAQPTTSIGLFPCPVEKRGAADGEFDRPRWMLWGISTWSTLETTAFRNSPPAARSFVCGAATEPTMANFDTPTELPWIVGAACTWWIRITTVSRNSSRARSASCAKLFSDSPLRAMMPLEIPLFRRKHDVPEGDGSPGRCRTA